MLIFGKEGVYPRVDITDAMGGAAAMRIWDASCTMPQDGRVGRLGNQFDDLADDDHDHCWSVWLDIATFTPDFIHTHGMRGTAFLSVAYFYDDKITPQTWAFERFGTSNVIEDCPLPCDYGWKKPHQRDGVYQPPERDLSVFNNYGMLNPSGPRFVTLEFIWKK